MRRWSTFWKILSHRVNLHWVTIKKSLKINLKMMTLTEMKVFPTEINLRMRVFRRLLRTKKISSKDRDQTVLNASQMIRLILEVGRFKTPQFSRVTKMMIRHYKWGAKWSQLKLWIRIKRMSYRASTLEQQWWERIWHLILKKLTTISSSYNQSKISIDQSTLRTASTHC